MVVFILQPSAFIPQPFSFILSYPALAGLALDCVGSLNGALLIRLVTAPERMHCVQMRTVLLVPEGVVMRTRCKLGLNVRFEMPVILVPTPPRYFALPRIVTLLPTTGVLPQISHFLDIALAPIAPAVKNRKTASIPTLQRHASQMGRSLTGP